MGEGLVKLTMSLEDLVRDTAKLLRQTPPPSDALAVAVWPEVSSSFEGGIFRYSENALAACRRDCELLIMSSLSKDPPVALAGVFGTDVSGTGSAPA